MVNNFCISYKLVGKRLNLICNIYSVTSTNTKEVTKMLETYLQGYILTYICIYVYNIIYYF